MHPFPSLMLLPYLPFCATLPSRPLPEPHFPYSGIPHQHVPVQHGQPCEGAVPKGEGRLIYPVGRGRMRGWVRARVAGLVLGRGWALPFLGSGRYYGSKRQLPHQASSLHTHLPQGSILYINLLCSPSIASLSPGPPPHFHAQVLLIHRSPYSTSDPSNARLAALGAYSKWTLVSMVLVSPSHCKSDRCSRLINISISPVGIAHVALAG